MSFDGVVWIRGMEAFTTVSMPRIQNLEVVDLVSSTPANKACHLLHMLPNELCQEICRLVLGGKPIYDSSSTCLRHKSWDRYEASGVLPNPTGIRYLCCPGVFSGAVSEVYGHLYCEPAARYTWKPSVFSIRPIGSNSIIWQPSGFWPRPLRFSASRLLLHCRSNGI